MEHHEQDQDLVTDSDTQMYVVGAHKRGPSFVVIIKIWARARLQRPPHETRPYQTLLHHIDFVTPLAQKAQIALPFRLPNRQHKGPPLPITLFDWPSAEARHVAAFPTRAGSRTDPGSKLCCAVSAIFKKLTVRCRMMTDDLGSSRRHARGLPVFGRYFQTNTFRKFFSSYSF